MTSKRKWIVGSRQSALALTQTNQVLDALSDLGRRHGMPCEFEVRRIVTKGDRILDVTLSKVGGKGLFVKEIEQALMDKEIDFAVHSMKDMPAALPEGLIVGCVPEREDPRDAFVAKAGWTLETLPQGARLGTSSLRRSSQMKFRRPDLVVEPLRGNIDSRLKRLESGEFDAILLASAGLRRMGWEDRITEPVSADVCVPAVGQGALALECREGDEELLALLKLFHHERTAVAVAAERAFLGRLNGGCQVPIGAYATIDAAGDVTLTGFVGTPDGSTLLRETAVGRDPAKLGTAVGETLLARGAARILEEAREE
ncbi:hydroxymethylbilane synthase [Paenibacillus antri]|uniref:Porphobilinogen deaminase n=1 Tax=Paenibacillus antri TaxID=2582848 RepID=A0A5R9GCN8_9BACL|nr:hydroxymethylbilane synthase [Paenibacillus antri]TLS53511.1 hydroxymethylbilane synthase [Paenibacillus antri]